MRNGKPHVQIYWEESDPRHNEGKGASLIKLGMSLPGQNQSRVDRDDPVREAWNVSTLVSRQAVKRGDVEVEACIAAGFTPEAALHLKAYAVPEGVSLADYIYDNELDHAPRPLRGWTSSGGTEDQRKSWLRAVADHGITLEQAVEWIDAGFPDPCSGIPELIKAGVSPQRAKEWDDDLRSRYHVGVGGNLYLCSNELKSDITLEEAIVWRTAMSSVNSSDSPLGSAEMEYRRLGFKPDEAARWRNIASYHTPLEKLAQLRAQKWSPSALVATMRELGHRGGQQLLDESFADDLIRVTPLVGGPKVVKAWTKIVHQSWDEGFDNPRAVEAIIEAEAWKNHAKKVTGVNIDPKDYNKMASLLPLQRDVYIEIMGIAGREDDIREYRVSRAMDLARVVGSPSNLRVLQEKGFPLGRTGTGIVQGSAHAMKGYDVFNAQSAPDKDRNKWMRSVATTLYWRNTHENRVTGDDMRKIIENPDIDPVLLKDTLLNSGGNISPVQLEGILAAGIGAAVSDGWL